jgi:molybdopterin-guanine dinucleotide biosynthesis protein A
VLGAVLAGGQGRRLGGAKATVRLNRRPLVSYPLEAVWRGLGNVVVVAKPDTELPPLPGVEVWVEPDEPQHPLTGVVHALSMAEGRPVLICGCDLPLLEPGLVRDLARADAGGAPAVIASLEGRLEPLLGRYQSEALPGLADALRDPGVRLTDAVAALAPFRYEVPDARLLFNVNTPEDVLQASALLAGKSQRGSARGCDQPNVKS